MRWSTRSCLRTVRRVAAGLMIVAPGISAQTTRVPADVQYSLLAKIITFDRSFTLHTHDDFVIGILYQRRVSKSRAAADELAHAIANSDIKTINGVRVRVVHLDVDTSALEDVLRAKGVDVAYIMPFKDEDVADVLDAVRRTRARSFTGVPEYVELGICVGIGIKHSRPEIIINIAAARAAGQDFSSQLLKLSRVVG